MYELPSNVKHYKSTPTFTQDTIPQGFLKNHSTKAGTWGILTVKSGKLKYVITQPGEEEEMILSATSTAIIAPQHLHFVEPLGEVNFYVAFYR